MLLLMKLGEDLSVIGQIYIFSNKFFGSLLIDPLQSTTASSTSALTSISFSLLTSWIKFSLTGVFLKTCVLTSRLSSKLADLCYFCCSRM